MRWLKCILFLTVCCSTNAQFIGGTYYSNDRFLILEANAFYFIDKYEDTISSGIWELQSNTNIISLCSYGNQGDPYLIPCCDTGIINEDFFIEASQKGSLDSMYFEFFYETRMASLNFILTNPVNNNTIYKGNTKDDRLKVTFHKSSFDDLMLFSLDISPNLLDTKWYLNGEVNINTHIVQLPVFYVVDKEVNKFEIDLTKYNRKFFKREFLKEDYVMNFNFDSLKWDGVVYYKVVE